MRVLRKQVDEIDKKIIVLLGKREGIVKKIGLEKKRKELGIRDRVREKEATKKRDLLAKKLKISYVSKLFKIITKNSRKLQK